MPALTPRQRAARDGIRAAQREHQRLGTTFTGRVDIFDVIEDARIWLMFQRLGRLYGAYRREGIAVGIIINTQHPLTLQRYTAAHEYAHYILGHEASADNGERIERPSRDLQEIAAQSFAGEFLMPLQLVNYELRTMGFTDLNLSNLSLNARQVYQLSLEFGVSYRATIIQLVGQHKITRTLGDQLQRQSPLQIKTGLAGIRPTHSWADVWLLDESQEGRRFLPRLRDEVHVMLAETPSTGSIWQLVESTGSVLMVTSDRFETNDEDVVGASGVRHVAFQVAQEGVSQIRLEKRRPWQQDGDTFGTFEATLNVIPILTGDADDGLSDRQKQALLANGQAA